MGVDDLQTERDAQDGGEHRRHKPARPDARVLGPLTSLGGHNHRGAFVLDQREGAIEEGQVEVVDVEVDDDVAARVQKSVA